MEKLNNLEAHLNNPKNESEEEEMVDEKGKNLEDLRDELFEKIKATEEERNSVQRLIEIGEDKIKSLESQKTGDEIMDGLLDRLINDSKKRAIDSVEYSITSSRPLRKMIDSAEKQISKLDTDQEIFNKESGAKGKELRKN
ncbi:hypothetical protein HOE22_12180 [Candidatus Woesearchaeota archaeon]|jgi:hypothetical protein|nr:hypothetical protein [Candidatus Woesearchaeota archaeon]MBT4730543.1 hypothetical protein [Candidatus Woesearchaeota archaeon]